jgi:hypothetical protein
LAGAAAGLSFPFAIGKSKTVAAAISDKEETTANLFPGFEPETVKTSGS